METDPFATDNVAYTLSSSEESRRERKSRVQNATWFEYTAKVSRGELSVSTCADELRKKHKLREEVARKKYLDKQLTRDQLTNLAYHLKDLNKVAESVPQNPSREDLEAILWKGWPELRDFEHESINRGAKTQKRRRAALDEEDEVQCVQSTAPVSLGCASCKGRASGCNRCISWRDEGLLPIKKV